MNDVTLAGSKLLHYHVAAFFRSRTEEYEVMRSYIKEGIDSGEKAVHICDPMLRHDHLQHLEQMGVHITDCTRTGQLEVLGWHDAYLKDGRFDADTMMALVEETIQTSHAEGFPRVRLLGHMEWASEGWPGAERLIEYEAQANYFLNRMKQPAVCIYDLNRFDGTTIMNVLRTHPYTIIDGLLRENPYYVPPEQLLGELASPKPGRS
ncbi:MEDS domain-containing protein [Hyalangium rubrum]|uniref:MEDS domain-containing protein n=1 Tax=Hyalangium rubrum TaxID=3103134 RepID=A0ABU5H2J3_9BACT|nr:MEDS domain-containing protein [Hyalangium sp. s54d21]MDY7227676.1 MEDS domain-containing protein [Hyalangium sp. s54d21]